ADQGAIRFFATDSTDVCFDLIELENEDIAFCGYQSDVGSVKEAMTLIRTDKFGVLKWERAYSLNEGGTSRAVQLLPTIDGSIFIGGFRATQGSMDEQIAIVKVDPSGNFLFEKLYGGSEDERLNDLKPTSDGGMLAVGTTGSFGTSPDNTNTNIYVLRMNSEGDTLWTRTFGTSKQEIGYSIGEASNGNILVVGNSDGFSGSSMDIVMYTLAPNGDSLDFIRSNTTVYEEARDMIRTKEGGFLMIGFQFSIPKSFDVFAVRVSESGVVDSTSFTTYGGPDNERTQSFGFFELKDGGFIIPAQTQSFGNGADDIMLLRINSDLSEHSKCAYGGTNDDRGRAAIQASDGTFVMIGITKSFALNDDFDMVFLKTGKSGYLGSDNSECL
ncbi:MAG: hypothetical protein AAF570_12105, partial [Bacteroidota bacterium]